MLYTRLVVGFVPKILSQKEIAKNCTISVLFYTNMLKLIVSVILILTFWVG